MVIVLTYHPLWREDESVVYNCCWSSPAQSFSGPSPAVPITTFYCLKFDTPLTWTARSPYLYPPGTGRPGYTPRHWVSFSSPHTTRLLRWRYWTSPPHRMTWSWAPAGARHQDRLTDWPSVEMWQKKNRILKPEIHISNIKSPVLTSQRTSCIHYKYQLDIAV
jgi:hypothetical protein